MTETTPACKWVASDQPRILPGRHEADCAGDCGGCEPCPRGHCVICRREHTDDAHPMTCPGCVGHVRDDLELIVDMHARLRSEAIARGMAGDRGDQVLGGDAMVMLAMTHREQTGLASDGDHTHENPADPVPPLLTLATWEDAWRDHLGHDAAGTASVADAAGYLSLMLTRMAQDAELPFDDFARDIRRTRGRMESTLHDRNLGDVANVGCFECGDRLERRLTERGFEDVWTCQGCRRRYTYAEYNFALRAALEASA